MTRYLTIALLLACSAPAARADTIVLAGGCFWGVQAVFEHTKGVSKAVAGYAGGEAATAHYDDVSSGTTGHAESVEVTYDPAKITLPELLDIYFQVAHNPTELNYQGPDHGTQYRSAIFTTTPEQSEIARQKIAELEKTKRFSGPIVTTVAPLRAFYPAEDYHQDFARLHPNHPYIAFYDLPKLQALQERFPTYYVK